MEKIITCDFIMYLAMEPHTHQDNNIDITINKGLYFFQSCKI